MNRQRDWKEGNSLQVSPYCVSSPFCNTLPRPIPRLALTPLLQATSTVLDSKIRDDLDRLKKIRNHRGTPNSPAPHARRALCCSCSAFGPLRAVLTAASGLRHYWNLRVRGQHTYAALPPVPSPFHLPSPSSLRC